MGRREDNKARTRQQLIDTGLQQFRDNGFDATRVQDIVAAVGVSQATFFNYFPTKQAILEAQSAYTAELYDALLRHELDRKEATVPARLEQITRVLAEYLQTDAETSTLLVSRTQLFFGQKTDPGRARHSHDLMASLFAEGQARGEIDATADPDQLAELYAATFMLTVTNWLTGWWGPTPQPLGERLVAALQVFLHGALATDADRTHGMPRVP